MPSPQEIVEHFASAYFGGDLPRARQQLADDFHFAGPAASFDSAEAYLRASAHVAPSVTGRDVQKLFADGPDVGIFYELMLDDDRRVKIADWYHVTNGKIASLVTILDTAPFRTGADHMAHAIDPVCGMRVDLSSNAITISYKETAYYFCAKGCATAFESAPERYLAG